MPENSQPNALTMPQLASKMAAIWYTVDDDIDKGHVGADDADANGRRFGVSRRNIIGLVNHTLSDNDDLTPEDLWDSMSDNAQDVELEERHYAPSSLEAYKEAEAYCSMEGHIVLDSFVSAFKTNLKDVDYIATAENVATALKVDTKDLPSEFWDEAINDDLTPLQALLSLNKN